MCLQKIRFFLKLSANSTNATAKPINKPTDKNTQTKITHFTQQTPKNPKTTHSNKTHPKKASLKHAYPPKIATLLHN